MVTCYIPIIEDMAPHLIIDDESPTDEEPEVTVNNVFVFPHWRTKKKEHYTLMQMERYQLYRSIFSLPVIMMLTIYLKTHQKRHRHNNCRGM